MLFLEGSGLAVLILWVVRYYRCVGFVLRRCGVMSEFMVEVSQVQRPISR